MDRSESIISYIREIGQELANQESGNYYLIDHMHKIRDELVQDLIKDHGYKDEKAVWDKIGVMSEKEQDKRMQQELENEKLEAQWHKQELEQEKQKVESLKQKQINKSPKNRIKTGIKKSRGFRI